MLFDDRLDTVLRSGAGGERAARTQFRQLLDLLGSGRNGQPGKLANSAYARLAELSDRIPPEEQSRILREPGLRLRNRRLVAFLAEGESKPAAAALATARLTEDDWLRLIPELSVVARGLLRHRRDLPKCAKQVLERLGVRDLVLPEPTRQSIRKPMPGTAEESHAPPPPALEAVSITPAEQARDRPLRQKPGASQPDAIRNLLRRIEEFRQGRREPPGTPRLPLGDAEDGEGFAPPDSFEFASDPYGQIDWASPHIAAQAVGIRLARHRSGAIAALEDEAARAMERRQPLRDARLAVDAGPAISGEWRLDAWPRFARYGGHFLGYWGRIRRPVPAAPERRGDHAAAERMRQMLHELRTPVSAIQGFAEIIQQQLYGPAPNEYRALAAAVAVDSAKLLAGFEEVDRLAKLETGAQEIETGESDFRTALIQTIQRLEGVLDSRNAGFELAVAGSDFMVGLARSEVLLLVWRLLASIAGELAPGERAALDLAGDGEMLTLKLALPRALAESEEAFLIRGRADKRVVSAGMFGTGFALRLARAETLAAGGSFHLADKEIAITLPLLTGSGALPSNGDQGRTADGQSV